MISSHQSSVQLKNVATVTQDQKIFGFRNLFGTCFIMTYTTCIRVREREGERVREK